MPPTPIFLIVTGAPRWLSTVPVTAHVDATARFDCTCDCALRLRMPLGTSMRLRISTAHLDCALGLRTWTAHATAHFDATAHATAHFDCALRCDCALRLRTWTAHFDCTRASEHLDGRFCRYTHRWTILSVYARIWRDRGAILSLYARVGANNGHSVRIMSVSRHDSIAIRAHRRQ